MIYDIFEFSYIVDIVVCVAAVV